MTKAHPVSLDYAAALDEKFHAPDFPHAAYHGHYAVMAGQKYDRIIEERANGTRSVHAFVERSTMKLIKAAGWVGPAKNHRGELSYRYDISDNEGFDLAVEAADPHGSYLYAVNAPIKN